MELGLSLGGATFNITKGNSNGRFLHSVAAEGDGSPPISAASSFEMSNKRSLSGEEGEEEIGQNDCRKKLRLSKDQSAFLEESYKDHNTLTPVSSFVNLVSYHLFSNLLISTRFHLSVSYKQKQKIALAKKLDLRPRQVEVWFQNRRARTKLKQTEVDCEYLKRRCETLTEENRRLEKELQDLRALNSSNPLFCLQSPATTLTMCPSCEATTTDTKPVTYFPQVATRPFYSFPSSDSTAMNSKV